MADINRLLKQLKDFVDSLNSLDRSKLRSLEAVSIAERLEQNIVAVEGLLGDRLVGNDDVVKHSGFLEESRRPGLLDLLRASYEEGLSNQVSPVSFQQPATKVYFCALRALLIGSINTKLICLEAVKKLTVVHILLTLNRSEFLDCRHAPFFETGPPRFLVRSLMVIHNLMQQSNENADIVRSLGGERTLRQYFDSCNNVIALNALLAFTHLVSEPKGDEISVNDHLIRHIQREMPFKLARVRTHLGEYFLAGMCAYLTRLIRCSEACGQALMRLGLLDFLAAILGAAAPPPGANTAKLRERDSSRDYSRFTCDWALADEKKKALVVCQTLASSPNCATENVAAMKSHSALIKSLEHLGKQVPNLKDLSSSVLTQIRQANQAHLKTRPAKFTIMESPACAASSSDIYWSPSVRVEAQDSFATPLPSPSLFRRSQSPETATKLSVAVSYAKCFKPQLVKRIIEGLKTAGIEVFDLDSEDTLSGAGSDGTLETMDTAAFLVCCSTAYQDDVDCRAQLSSACKRKLVLVPIQLDNYTQRGWLGLAIKGKTCTSFESTEEDDEKFGLSLQMLIKKISEEVRNAPAIS